jgi:hypothetical protein
VLLFNLSEKCQNMVKMEQHHQQFKQGGGAAAAAAPGGSGFSGIYESAHFANILIEFENDNREMAVDVPDSFVAQTKTPPKYPPPSLGDREEGRSSGSSFSALSFSNGHSLNRRSRNSPPDLVAPHSRDHLRIEKDGRLINTMEAPPLSRDSQPTPEQSERIRKYGEEIARRAAEQERKSAHNEFLRHSIRNSQKMRALKGNWKCFIIKVKSLESLKVIFQGI